MAIDQSAKGFYCDILSHNAQKSITFIKIDMSESKSLWVNDMGSFGCPVYDFENECAENDKNLKDEFKRENSHMLLKKTLSLHWKALGRWVMAQTI